MDENQLSLMIPFTVSAVSDAVGQNVLLTQLHPGEEMEASRGA